MFHERRTKDLHDSHVHSSSTVESPPDNPSTNIIIKTIKFLVHTVMDNQLPDLKGDIVV